MKRNCKQMLCALLAAVMCVSSMTTAGFAAETERQLVGDIAKGKYMGDFGKIEGEKNPFKGEGDMTPFTKISHPNSPNSTRKYDPTKNAAYRAMHEKEVFADGLLDYVANGLLAAPGSMEGANGQGDRGQTYSWTGIAAGDWMYVSTQYNSAGETGNLMGNPLNPDNLEALYGGDYWYAEPDGGRPGSTLSKINVKTGEVKILMSAKTNGLDAQFRSSIEYKGKLYFCGSVNHLPCIYEVDPTNDAFQCVYQDPSMKYHPDGLAAAWQEARYEKRICPAIRGLTTFGDYLVISCVGLDENPYIAISNNPSSGEFTIIAKAWKDGKVGVEDGELFGYPACHIPDSIFGGSIWEMATFNGKLYVAMCTGTPENAETHEKVDENGKPIEGAARVIDAMQSFALVVGELDEGGNAMDPGAWHWRALAGDQENDNAPYTFGIDPERHRAGACNLVVYKDHLYIGEYNDTQIAFQNMTDKEFTFLRRNMEESIGMYRLGADEKIEKVMGAPTKLFPEVHSNVQENGFGQKESQYIWQSRVFNDKLYMGTFDETMILYPLAKKAEEMQGGHKASVVNEINALTTLAEENVSLSDADASVFESILAARDAYEAEQSASALTVDDEVVAGDSHVLLPESVMDAEPVVKVDSVESLMTAMMTARDLMNVQGELSITERLTNLVKFYKLQDEINAYAETEEVPAVMANAVDTVAGPGAGGMGGGNDDIMYVMQNLAGSIAGFDMYVFDGSEFKQVTRTGMGDPYNQGLRVFASNNDPENPWMCIGSANPFYGTQIWRMENENTAIIDPEQEMVQVRFVDGKGEPVKGTYHKANEVYVNKGETTIPLESLSTLTPDDHTRIETDVTNLDIQTDENGVKFVQIAVSPRTQVVNLNFVAGSETAGSGKLDNVRPSQKYLAASDVTNALPAGYELADVKAKYKIQSSESGLYADIPVVTNKGESVEFQVTVNGGEGTGAYNVGQTVYINATVPADQEFDHWEVVTEAPAPTPDPENPNPENPEAAAEGDEPAAPAVELKDPKLPHTSFVMPAHDVTVTAHFKEKAEYTATIEGGTATVKEGDEPATSVTGFAGTKVTVTADQAPEGQVFVKWISQMPDGSQDDTKVRFANYKATTTTFQMQPLNVTIKAIFETVFDVTTESATAEPSKAYKGQAVHIVAAEPEAGMAFDHWEFTPALADENDVVNAKAADTYFTMPENAIAVKAVYVEREVPAKAVAGTVTSYGDETAEVTIELFAADAEQAAYTVKVTGNAAPYTIENVEAGTYTMKVTKANHIARTYEVVVTEDGAAQDAQINLMGDVNLDGKVDTRDWTSLYKHVNGTAVLEGYALDCANVTGDDKVDTRDWTRLYKHVNGLEPLWKDAE